MKNTRFFNFLSGRKSKAGEMFEGELLFRTLLTTFLQIFCKINLNSKISVEGFIDLANNFLRNSKAGMCEIVLF